MNNHLGVIVLTELYDCNVELLKSVTDVEDIMIDAAVAGNATIVSTSFKQFDPWGVSGVIVISESHLAIHTWPEHGYAAIDAFTCGTEMNPLKCIEHLKTAFQSKRMKTEEIHRGDLRIIKASQPG